MGGGDAARPTRGAGFLSRARRPLAVCALEQEEQKQQEKVAVRQANNAVGFARLRGSYRLWSGKQAAAPPPLPPARLDLPMPKPTEQATTTGSTSWPSERARESISSDMLSERIDGMHARVMGQIPAWLEGSLYRNGPGMFEGAHALMDGLAMVVRFKVEGRSSQVVFSHRFLETTCSKAVKDSGGIKWRLAHPERGGTTLGGLRYAGGLALGTLQYGVSLGDNAVISIFPHGKELIAHTETAPGTFRVDPETLETLGRVRYRDDVHGMLKSAHPHTLPNGDIITMAADFYPWMDRSRVGRHIEILRPPEITVCRQRASSVDEREKLATVPYPQPAHPTWVHDLAVSKRYVAVVQNPVRYNVGAMLTGSSTSDGVVFDWRPREGSLIHIVPLDGQGPVRVFRAPAFLATHWVNAWDSADGRFLHLDAAVADSPAVMGHWSLANMRAGPAGGRQVDCSGLRRLTIDLHRPDGSLLNQQPLLEHLVPDAACGYAFELPAVNPAVRGRPYRYAYAACCVRPSNCWNALCKTDLQEGTVRRWHEPGGVAWEPIFVPRPGATEEDDGICLSTITQSDGRAALLMLDARTWTEVARAVLPLGLPNGLHGCWVPADNA